MIEYFFQQIQLVNKIIKMDLLMNYLIIFNISMMLIQFIILPLIKNFLFNHKKFKKIKDKQPYV